jgi:hypothetical protein
MKKRRLGDAVALGKQEQEEKEEKEEAQAVRRSGRNEFAESFPGLFKVRMVGRGGAGRMSRVVG